jgi:hypothetical protein
MARTKRPRQRVHPHERRQRHLGKLAARKLRPIQVPIRNPKDFAAHKIVKPVAKQCDH